MRVHDNGGTDWADDSGWRWQDAHTIPFTRTIYRHQGQSGRALSSGSLARYEGLTDSEVVQAFYRSTKPPIRCSIAQPIDVS
jgi:hypothetical protein